MASSGTPHQEPAKHILYGMPCAQCGIYYSSDLKACPVCGSVEQVSAKNPKLTFPRLRDLLPQCTVGGSNLDEAGKEKMVT